MSKASLIENTIYQFGLEYTEDYSGRGMFGSECVSVSGKDQDLADWWDFLDDEEREEIGSPRKDSMGLGTVWYWPGIKASHQEINEESK